MIEDVLNNYQREIECNYKGENYLVRDNGSILRKSRPGKKIRKDDDVWTFGKIGVGYYMHIGDARVHRIVATAFHGNAPSDQHIVDHIDTNRQNNRPENLRWVTKLENALNNPITRKRIIAICGSVEAFLENPSLLGSSKIEKNFSWMKTVTPEEAKISLERLKEWANSDAVPSGGKLGPWIYEKPKPYFKQSNKDSQNVYNENNKTAPQIVDSLTPGAKQKVDRWRTPTEFLCVPKDKQEKTLEAYLKNLTSGAIFSKNRYGESIVDKASFNKDKTAVIVKTYNHSGEDVKKGGFNLKITFENGCFIHETIGSYFTKEGAEKYFKLSIGEEWTGGDVFDDFC